MLARREIYITAGTVYFLLSDPKQTKCCNLVLLTSPGSCFPMETHTFGFDSSAF